MPKFLYQASYEPEGLKGLAREGGTGRRAATERAVEALGGRVEAFYYAFGSDDVVVIVDLPDQRAAAALALVVNADGRIRAKTVVLLTPEELDEATKLSVDFRPPGA